MKTYCCACGCGQIITPGDNSGLYIELILGEDEPVEYFTPSCFRKSDCFLESEAAVFDGVVEADKNQN